jgi:hypothetical protein
MLLRSPRRKPISRSTFVLFVALLCGCAPVTADHCFVRAAQGGNLKANVILTDESFKDVVHTTVLVNVDRSSAGYGRLFEVVVRLHPGETRSVEVYLTDRTLYEFKSNSGISRGCEVEFVTFADRTQWELPTPL